MGAFGIYRGDGETGPARQGSLRSASGASPAAAAPWHTIHKGALLYPCGLQGSGTLLQLVNTGPKREYLGGGLRGIVGDMPSRGSHRRFCQAMAGVPWENFELKDLWVVVLTYHGVPRDGLQVRRDKKALFRRLDRLLGPRGKGCWGGIWVKEFQERGSWHLHAVLHTPLGAPYAFNLLVRDMWLSIIHEDNDLAAFLHGVECSRAVSMQKVKGYLSKYMGKSGQEGVKSYQKRQPAWFKGGGRWWGVLGHTLARHYESFRLQTVSEFHTVKRLFRGYVRSITGGKYTPKSYGAMYGMTILGHGADYAALRGFIRWLSGERLRVCVLQTC